MSDSLVNRWAGALGVLASVLIVLSESVRLGIGLFLDSDASKMSHTLTYGLALLGMCTLLLAHTAIYVSEPRRFGKLGLVGYLFAFVGTTLVAGDWWFEAFVVPSIAPRLPTSWNYPPAGRCSLVRSPRSVSIPSGGSCSASPSFVPRRHVEPQPLL
jgi:hypothetical protein